MVDLVLKVAAKAVIVNNKNKVLILREGDTYAEGSQIGLYGLPGGRLNMGEAFNDGLKREAKEETGLDIEPLHPVYVGEWRPVIKGAPHQIIAVFVKCRAVGGKVQLSDEHDSYEWIDPRQHSQFKMMEPDDKVLDALAALNS